MSDEDDFVRITLRIPKAVHTALMESAAKKKSMNAEIIERLERSFGPFAGTMAATETGQDGFKGEGFGGLGSPGPARPRIRSLLEMTPDELDTFLSDRLAPKLDEIIDNSVDAALKRHSVDDSRQDTPKKDEPSFDPKLPKPTHGGGGGFGGKMKP